MCPTYWLTIKVSYINKSERMNKQMTNECINKDEFNTFDTDPQVAH